MVTLSDLSVYPSIDDTTFEFNPEEKAKSILKSDPDLEPPTILFDSISIEFLSPLSRKLPRRARNNSYPPSSHRIAQRNPAEFLENSAH